MYKKIIKEYPELKDSDFVVGGCIKLQDDGDGIVYISEWNYHKPIPAGLKLGKQSGTL